MSELGSPAGTTVVEDEAAEVDAPAAETDATHGDDAETGHDYVTFEMQGEMYAFEMERVQEIIRMPDLVRVPLGPVALEGLANLRGRVLPVVSLRQCCRIAATEHDEATRIVVVEAAGATLGFVVDRVAAVISVEDDQVESAATVQSAVRSDLLEAVLKGKDGVMTTVLDIEHLVVNEFVKLARSSAAAAATASGWAAGTGDIVEDEFSDTLELVSFGVDGQEYALPIDRVQEIVQAPDRITAVPNSASRVLGVMDLRGGLLPVVSLRRVFGLPVGELAPHNRIVVITVDRGGVESLVGVVMDTVREVLRVPVSLVGTLPSVVSGGGSRSEVNAVCRLEDGRRLVSVLSADALVDLDELAELQIESDEIASTDVEDTVSDDGRGDDELLVVFRLESEEYCVDVDAVQEIIRVPETLVRVPKTFDFVEGLVNLRGAVLPVVDLRTRLGLPRVARDERQRIVVLIIGGLRTGFVVDSVAEVARVGATDLESAPELSEEQAKVIARVANLPVQKRMLLVLEPDELLAAEQVAALAGEVPGTELAA